ncbi:MAG: hybrid sensor histidine kinase/response regulator [Pseudomonadota bacterium]
MGYSSDRAEARAEEISRRTADARRSLVAKSALTAVPFNIVNAAVLGGFMLASVDAVVLGAWFAAMCVLSVVRLLTLAPSRRSGEPPSARLITIYAVLSAAVGGLWGAAPFLLPVNPDPAAVMAAVVMIAGMSAGAALTSAAVPRLTAAYTLPAMSLLALFFALQGGAGNFMMAALCGVFFLIMRRLSKTYAGTLGDAVTANVHLEEARRESEAQSLALSRLADRHEAAAKSAENQMASSAALMANMSHELGGPLNGVLGLAELLSESRLDEEQSKLLARLRESGNQLNRHVNDILDVSRIDAGRLDLVLDDVTAQDLGEAAERFIAPRARGKKLSFQIHYEGDTTSALRVDRSRLTQMVETFLINAARFTDAGGISLSFVVKAGADGKARLRASVRDTGCGVPASARQNLFNPFAVEEPDASVREAGTGLGLLLISKLASLMNGSAGYEPGEDGKGSVFWFEVGARVSARADRFSAEERISLSNRRLRIVVAEQDGPRQSVLLGYLKALNCVVTCVESGSALTEALSASAYDCVVIGMSLDDGEAEDVAADIRALASTASLTPVIRLESELDGPAQTAGQETLLRSPVTEESVLEALGLALSADQVALASLRRTA